MPALRKKPRHALTWLRCRQCYLEWEARPSHQATSDFAPCSCQVRGDLTAIVTGTDAVDGVGAAEDQMIARDGGRGPE